MLIKKAIALITASVIISSGYTITLCNNQQPPSLSHNIPDSYYAGTLPSKILPITEVIKKNISIPLKIIYNNPNWKRNAFYTYWNYSRWSFLPVRIHYAMHRLFAIYPTASVSYDFVHDLGIADENIPFRSDFSNSYNIFSNITVVTMQSNIEKIFTYGNQIVLIARPKRYGMQVLNIPVNKIKPLNPNELLLLQLSTHDGEEIDYTTIGYVKPINMR